MSEENGIEVFQDLTIRPVGHSLLALRKALIARSLPPWRYAIEKETEVSEIAAPDEDVIVFERAADDKVAAAGLVLWSRGDGYEVTNIVPREVRELGYSGYNSILQDFIERVAKPAAVDVPSEIETTKDHQSIEDWLPHEVLTSLRRFSALANKSTGSSHPTDRKRWLAFIINAHKEHVNFDTDKLVRWLVEIEGWRDESAHDLASEYEFALGLLTEYDHRRS